MQSKNIDLNVAFRKANSRYKIWISFKNKTSIALYGAETNNTYSQMLHGHVKVLCLDKLKGFENCRLLAEKIYLGKYITAIIYDTKTDTPVLKYVNDTLEELQQVILSDAERYQNFIVKVIGNKVELIPTDNVDQIDFKTEIQNNLLK